jgi:hypothetical protein
VFATAVGVDGVGEGDVGAIVAGEDGLGIVFDELGAEEGRIFGGVVGIGDVIEVVEAIFGI